MPPMSVAEMPIAEIRASHRPTGDGVHLVARNYRKGVRLDPHMHREAQLVYAARGTMQVTTPTGRWLVPPDRAVWVPARLEHAIDVLADIEMRTLYFDVDQRQRIFGHDITTELWLSVPPSDLDATGRALADHPEVAFACVQPRAGSQASTVQGWASLQLGGEPGAQMPA